MYALQTGGVRKAKGGTGTFGLTDVTFSYIVRIIKHKAETGFTQQFIQDQKGGMLMDEKRIADAVLSDEEVQAASGGEGEVMTRMECDTCGLVTRWPGNLVGESFPCTRYIEGKYCTGHLTGVSAWWDE